MDPSELLVERLEGSTIATLSGEIDLSNAEQIGRSIAESISNQELRLVIDLGAVGYLDSAGIAMLFGLSRQLAEHQQQLVLLVSAESPVRRSLQVSGWPAAVPVVETLTEAVNWTPKVP